MTRRGLVLGCGGTVGGAWQVGALSAIQNGLGWDPRTAEVIVGSSSGAHLATMLGCGVSVDQLLAAQQDKAGAPEPVRRFFTHPPAATPRLPSARLTSVRLAAVGLRTRSGLLAMSGLAPTGRTQASFLDDLADGLTPPGSWVPHPATWLVAVDIESGQRIAFGSPGSPPTSVRDALRASWAIPGWYPPVTIGGRRYLDGGAASPTSADLIADLNLDEVIIVSPMASQAGVAIPGALGRLEGTMRAAMTHTLEAEIAKLNARGTRVVRVHPSASELSEMGFNFMNPARRLPALNAALQHVPTSLANSASRGARVRYQRSSGNPARPATPDTER